MKPHNFFYFAILLICSACLKDEPRFDGRDCDAECIIFTGKVIEQGTNNPLSANIDITFHFGGWSYPVVSNIGSIKADKTGIYNFRFPGEDYNGYGFFVVKASMDGYQNSFRNEMAFYSIDSTSFDIPMIASFILIPKTDLRINLKVNKPETFQAVDYQLMTQEGNYNQKYTAPHIPADTSFTYSFASNQTVRLKYSYTKEFRKTEVEETFELPPSSSKCYSIIIE